ncbi:DUF4179 domain-containing protein [uncultured Tissierella sp.]|uniref:DUF4179 domain-containing protein n=1 Tax=uncultured Tissierella sp. TaxID=448160 RepID=UPI00280433A0|nr:DUF4179 domain-containing protein [uncultured Tissierella sp.]MDU5083346.1 DUF4179 domain-containing protein [Bacillota bacterium]
MDNIESLLNEGKNKLNKLKIPENVEDRLRDALDNIPNKKRKFHIKWKVAALIIAILLIGYNVDTLAYYAKQLIGYDNVMNGTLQELNELGKGQIINKSCTFKDGSKVTLDGIMLDDNNLIVFYTINDPSGNVEEIYRDFGFMYVQGLFGVTYNRGGHGQVNEDKTEMKWIMTCDKPMFYERKMKLKFHSIDMEETGIIEFKLDRNQAMGHSLKIGINKEIEADQRKIKIKSLIASPTSTVIKGQIKNIIELGIDKVKGEHSMSSDIELSIIANGKDIQKQGASMSGSTKGSRFNMSYDALPHDTKDIQIVLKSFSGYHDIKEVIELQKGKINKDMKILEQDIRINEVYESEGNTYINITTDEDLILSTVFLDIDGEKVEAEQTIEGNFEDIVEGDTEKINQTRTIEFKGTGENLKLDIQRIRYNRTYNETIYEYSIEQ